MPDETPSASINRELAAKITAAYVRRAQIGSDQLGTLISTVHQALAGLGKPPPETSGERTPAVPIRRSVHRDYVVCLECGWRGLMVRRHLTTGHGLTVSSIARGGTSPVNIRWSHSAIASGDPVWRNGSASGGVWHPVKNRSQSRPKPRQQRNRDLGGEEGRDQQRRRRKPKLTSD